MGARHEHGYGSAEVINAGHSAQGVEAGIDGCPTAPFLIQIDGRWYLKLANLPIGDQTHNASVDLTALVRWLHKNRPDLLIVVQ